jgi:X-Pro dipeptidyl-peptidase (S15 family)
VKFTVTSAPRNGKPREVKIRVHDGVDIAVALCVPEGDGRFPVVLGASPYRYDNNALPASPQFLWRETGPIGLYVERGYVYAQMDARGCGKSGGEFRSSTATSRKTSMTSSNGSAIGRGRTAKSAASASPTFACCNGGWRSANRRRLPASPLSTA